MENEEISIRRDRSIEELHSEIQQWKSNLQFMDDELIFIDRLLNSYVFQPNTPNLFERLQDYKSRLKHAKISKQEVCHHISRHENTLGGILECTDSLCDLGYYRKHDKLQATVAECLEGFQELKSGIFNYAGGILKQRKP